MNGDIKERNLCSSLVLLRFPLFFSFFFLFINSSANQKSEALPILHVGCFKFERLLYVPCNCD